MTTPIDIPEHMRAALDGDAYVQTDSQVQEMIGQIGQSICDRGVEPPVAALALAVHLVRHAVYLAASAKNDPRDGIALIRDAIDETHLTIDAQHAIAASKKAVTS